MHYHHNKRRRAPDWFAYVNHMWCNVWVDKFGPVWVHVRYVDGTAKRINRADWREILKVPIVAAGVYKRIPDWSHKGYYDTPTWQPGQNYKL